MQPQLKLRFFEFITRHLPTTELRLDWEGQGVQNDDLSMLLWKLIPHPNCPPEIKITAVDTGLQSLIHNSPQFAEDTDFANEVQAVFDWFGKRPQHLLRRTQPVTSIYILTNSEVQVQRHILPIPIPSYHLPITYKVVLQTIIWSEDT